MSGVLQISCVAVLGLLLAGCPSSWALQGSDDGPRLTIATDRASYLPFEPILVEFTFTAPEVRGYPSALVFLMHSRFHVTSPNKVTATYHARVRAQPHSTIVGGANIVLRHWLDLREAGFYGPPGEYTLTFSLLQGPRLQPPLFLRSANAVRFKIEASTGAEAASDAVLKKYQNLTRPQGPASDPWPVPSTSPGSPFEAYRGGGEVIEGLASERYRAAAGLIAGLGWGTPRTEMVSIRRRLADLRHCLSDTASPYLRGLCRYAHLLYWRLWPAIMPAKRARQMLDTLRRDHRGTWPGEEGWRRVADPQTFEKFYRLRSPLRLSIEEARRAIRESLESSEQEKPAPGPSGDDRHDGKVQP